MKPTDLNVSSLQICTGETRYTFPVEQAVYDVCIRSDKPFRLFVSSDKHGRVCIGPKADGDLSFDGRFRMICGERFDVHAMKSATVGVRIVEVSKIVLGEMPDPRPVEIPIPQQLTMEQKIALEVERRLARDNVQATPVEFLEDEGEIDWDDWSPYMEMEPERDQPTQSDGEQTGEAGPVSPPEGQEPKQQSPAKAGGKGMAEPVDASGNSS